MNGPQNNLGPSPKQTNDPKKHHLRRGLQSRNHLHKRANGAPHSVHFSSRSDEWITPQWLFDELNKEFSFTLDPYATHTNAKCERYFTCAENGLAQDRTRDVVFMTPPYGREIGRWVQKAWQSAAAGATVVCLVPAGTDTGWWRAFIMRAEPRFLKVGSGLANRITLRLSRVRLRSSVPFTAFLLNRFERPAAAERP